MMWVIFLIIFAQMSYLEQLQEIILWCVELEQELAKNENNPTLRSIIRSKSGLSDSKKKINKLMEDLEIKKREIMKRDRVSASDSEKIEKEVLTN